MARILVTNGGPHPADKWAMATAETIFDINSIPAGDRSIAAQKFQLQLAEILEAHHGNLQSAERANLKADVNHILSPLGASDLVDEVVQEIVAAAKGSLWELHFLKTEVQNEIAKVLGEHFSGSQHVERLWHADRNPDCEVSQSYKARFHG